MRSASTTNNTSWGVNLQRLSGANQAIYNGTTGLLTNTKKSTYGYNVLYPFRAYPTTGGSRILDLSATSTEPIVTVFKVGGNDAHEVVPTVRVLVPVFVDCSTGVSLV